MLQTNKIIQKNKSDKRILDKVKVGNSFLKKENILWLVMLSVLVFIIILIFSHGINILLHVVQSSI